MIPFCLILGDSTGVGTAGALAREGIQCEIHAHVGARSSGVLEEWQGRITPAVALIALGSNDVGDPRLERRLIALRARTRAPRVTWLAPYNRTAALIVMKVALRFGDKVIPLAQLPTRDGVHPTSYRPISGLLGWKLLSKIRKDVSAETRGAWPREAASVPVRRAVVQQMQ